MNRAHGEANRHESPFAWSNLPRPAGIPLRREITEEQKKILSLAAGVLNTLNIPLNELPAALSGSDTSTLEGEQSLADDLDGSETTAEHDSFTKPSYGQLTAFANPLINEMTRFQNLHTPTEPADQESLLAISQEFSHFSTGDDSVLLDWPFSMDNPSLGSHATNDDSCFSLLSLPQDIQETPETTNKHQHNELAWMSSDLTPRLPGLKRANSDCTVLSTARNKRRKPQKRGPFRDEEERLETGKTRELGACIRCAMQRIRCVSNTSSRSAPCLTCSVSRPGSLCLRYKISDARLFDKGEHPQFRWSKRWPSMAIVEINSWASQHVLEIKVTQDVMDLAYPLKVRMFVPQEGDSMHREWTAKDGTVHRHLCASYAIENMLETAIELQVFVNRNIAKFVSYYIDAADELLSPTYAMALRQSRDAKTDLERSLLCNVLRLWVAIRMESRSERICSDELLNTAKQDYDEDHNGYQHYLLPPVISAQIELIVTATLLNPLRTEVLRQLQNLVRENKTKYWFTIYLTVFVLLHSCGLITIFQEKQARKYGMESKYLSDVFVSELHQGANFMLGYFHYRNKGAHPFHSGLTPQDITMAGLHNYQVEFVKNVTKAVNKRKQLFQQIRTEKSTEHQYYFISQLYDVDWKPR